MQPTPAGFTAKPNTRKHFSHRNKTIVLSAEEKGEFRRQLLFLNSPQSLEAISGSIINQELEEAAPFLPSGCVNLLIMDPPYNLNKTYNKSSFRRMSLHDYEMTLEKWLTSLIHTLAPDATVYICGDWQSSPAVYNFASRHLKIRNRITWEREKGRGAKNNWKNCSEDIWFCTVSGNHTFHADRVKLTRKVIAPYRDTSGFPRDWVESDAGKIRLTYPSNLWSNISIPFWSNGGEHRTSDTKTGEADCQTDSGQLQRKRRCFRPFSRQRHHRRCFSEITTPVLRHRKRTGLLLRRIKTPGIGEKKPDHSRVWKGRFLGAQHIAAVWKQRLNLFNLAFGGGKK